MSAAGSQLVLQLGRALEPINAAAEPLTGTPWREAPGYILFFGAIFMLALPFWVSGAHPCWSLLVLCCIMDCPLLLQGIMLGCCLYNVTE